MQIQQQLLAQGTSKTERPKGYELTPQERAKIVGAREVGASWRQIGRAFGISPSTARNTVARASKRVDSVSQPRSGRPRELSERDERHILRTLQQNPRIKHNALVEKCGINVARSTISQMLKRHGMRRTSGGMTTIGEASDDNNKDTKHHEQHGAYHTTAR